MECKAWNDMWLFYGMGVHSTPSTDLIFINCKSFYFKVFFFLMLSTSDGRILLYFSVTLIHGYIYQLQSYNFSLHVTHFSSLQLASNHLIVFKTNHFDEPKAFFTSSHHLCLPVFPLLFAAPAFFAFSRSTSYVVPIRFRLRADGCPL